MRAALFGKMCHCERSEAIFLASTASQDLLPLDFPCLYGIPAYFHVIPVLAGILGVQIHCIPFKEPKNLTPFERPGDFELYLGNSCRLLRLKQTSKVILYVRLLRLSP